MMKVLKHISYYLLSLTTIIAAMSSCSDEYTEGLTATKDPHYLNVDKTSMSYSAQGSTQQLGVQSTGVSWTLSNSAKWITLSQTSGSENASVGVTVAVNDEYSDKGRAATMTLSGSGATTRNITVNQESPSLTLTVSPASVELSAAARSTAGVTVTCNNDTWTISVADESWLTATKNSDMVTITASENTTGSSRSNTVSVSSGSKIETIKVMQKAPNVTSSSENFSFGHAKSSQSFKVTSDVSWTAVTNSSWIDISPKSGNAGTTKVDVSVTQNTSKETRTGTFTIGTKEVKVTQEGVALSASPTSLEFAEEGETLPLTITSNTTWKLSASDDITFSQTTGEGNATVNVTMKENTGTVIKSVITLEATDGSQQSMQISVSQNGSGVIVINTLDVFASEGGTTVYSVPSYSSWTAEVPSAYSSWIHITPAKGSKDESMTIKVDETTEVSDRNGYINLTYDFGAKYRININQYGIGIKASVSSYQFFAKGGDSNPITVQSAGTVTTSTSVSWLTAELNGNLLTITAAENLTGKARSGKVTLSLSDSTQKVEISVTQTNQHGDFLINEYNSENNLTVEPVPVDLGLPSGTLWATFNVGAKSPEEYGLFFGAGETIGYSSLSMHYFGCRVGELDSIHDAATTNWGVEWQIPSLDQIGELLDECIWTWDSIQNGYSVKSKTNSNSIFLPVAGHCYFNASSLNEQEALYLSRYYSTYSGWYALELTKTSRKFWWSRVDSDGRPNRYGYSVRPVRTTK